MSRGYGLPRSNVLRWQSNLRRGYPPIRRPGPPKHAMPDQLLLDEVIATLPHGKQRTKGTGALYDAWRGFISRDLLNQRVAEHRRSLNREQRDQFQLLAWQYPGTVWAMDEAEMEGIRWLLVVDLASRYRFDLLLADALPSTRIVGHLEMLFRQHTPPLTLKRDNGSNLASAEVDQLLGDWGIHDLTSPPYYPRYNGAVEYAQREIKLVAKILHETHGMPLAEALPLAPQVINAKPRPCLHGATATEVFYTPNPALAGAFTKENRKENRHWIDDHTQTILSSMSVHNRHAQAAARRLATETWMLNQGLVTPVRAKTVSPHFR
jgi:transposase InsO family protein